MIQETLLYIIAILPVFLIGNYIYKKDKNKEPPFLLVKLFLLGIISCFLVLAVTILLSFVFPLLNKDTTAMNYLELLLYTFIGVAFIEESAKLLMLYKLTYKNKEFDEGYDMIVYAVFVALGFAVFENLLYIVSSGSLWVGLFRGISAVPGHACYGLFMGYYLSLAKFSNLQNKKDQERINKWKSLFIPVVLHGIYDFCVLSGNLLLVAIFIIFITQLFIFSIQKLNYLVKNNQLLVKQNKYCPHCGKVVKGKYCWYCGKQQE